jgi:hypothetical protein
MLHAVSLLHAQAHATSATAATAAAAAALLQVSFRVRIGRRHRRDSKGVYPPQLDVKARWVHNNMRRCCGIAARQCGAYCFKQADVLLAFCFGSAPLLVRASGPRISTELYVVTMTAAPTQCATSTSGVADCCPASCAAASPLQVPRRGPHYIARTICDIRDEFLTAFLPHQLLQVPGEGRIASCLLLF